MNLKYFWLMADPAGTPPKDDPKDTPKDEPKDQSKDDKKDEKKPDEDASKAQAKLLKELQAKVKAYEEKEKAEADKNKSVETKLTEAEQRAKAAERKALVAELAYKKGLPADAIKRVQGETESEIEADMDELLKIVKSSSEGEKQGVGNPKQPGSGGSGNNENPKKELSKAQRYLQDREARLRKSNLSVTK